MLLMLRFPFIVLAVVAFGLPQAAELAPTGTLRVSFLAGNPVQGRVDAQTGELTGPVADLVPVLAKRLGVPYRIIPAGDAAAVIATIKSGEADVGFLAYEAARATQVDFSEPYLLMGNAYLVRADSPIRGSADVDRAGVTLAAVKGQSQQVYVSEHVKNAQIKILAEVPPGPDIVRMLVGGEIDAFAANRQRMEDVARTSPAVRVLSDNFSAIGQALVVERGNSARIAELNRFVAEVRASGLVQSSIDRARLTGVEVPR
jgi:polar amino acid transport system substrate-binding protein